MCGREDAFAPSFLPGARAAGAHGEERANDVLRVETELGAKSAANVRGDEPQPVERQSEALAQRSGMDVRQLTRGVMCQPVGAAIEIRQHGPAFEWCGC